MTILIEACVGSVEDAIRAEAAGADRIELNRALDRDGLTPTLADAVRVLSGVTIPVVVMVRPHDRGFVVAQAEFSRMVAAGEAFAEAGAAGLVVGFLDGGGGIDVEHTRRWVHHFEQVETVFHRAFDYCTDPRRGFEQLMDAGVTRLLTSGQAPTALDGVELIAELVERGAGRIEVLPGTRIGPGSAREVVRQTGCTQLHGSFRDPDGAFSPEKMQATLRTLNRA